MMGLSASFTCLQHTQTKDSDQVGSTVADQREGCGIHKVAMASDAASRWVGFYQSNKKLCLAAGG